MSRTPTPDALKVAMARITAIAECMMLDMAEASATIAKLHRSLCQIDASFELAGLDEIERQDAAERRESGENEPGSC